MADAADPRADYHAYMTSYRANLKAHAEALKARDQAARKRQPRPRPHMAKPEAPADHQAGTTRRSPLTEDDVRSIRRRHALGEPTSALATDFGIHVVSVNRIASRRRWAHLSD